MADMMPKVTAIKEECAKRGLEVLVEVDGGMSEKTAPVAASAGVDVCVSGTGIFKAKDMVQAISVIKSGNVFNE